MKMTNKLTALIGVSLLSGIALAGSGKSIPLTSSGNLSPQQKFSVDLSPLENNHYYTVRLTLKNVNNEAVPFHISTKYGSTDNGSVGTALVTHPDNTTTKLIKNGDGYDGMIAANEKSIEVDVYNVGTNHGKYKVLTDKLHIQNTSQDKVGAGIQTDPIIAEEQEDVGAAPDTTPPLNK
jgi:hypothetical protein